MLLRLDKKIYNLCSAYFDLKDIRQIQDNTTPENVYALINITRTHPYFRNVEFTDGDLCVIATMACTIAVVQLITGQPYTLETVRQNLAPQAVVEALIPILVGEEAYGYFKDSINKKLPVSLWALMRS